MIGRNEAVILDTNAVIDMLNNRTIFETFKSRFPDSAVCISVITQIEVLSYPLMTKETEMQTRNFLEDIIIVGVEGPIVEAAVDIRLAAQKPKIKLPDAVIAATAVILEAPLVTRDSDLLKFNFPGLSTLSIA